MASIGSSSSPERDAAAAADVVVGLVSYQDIETIGAVAREVRAGLAASFANRTSRVVLADGGSTDGSAARVREALVAPGELLEVTPARAGADRLDVPYHGIPGKARALYAVLRAARELGARACVVLDGSVRSVAPQWVEWLARPILEHDVDFVSSYYSRQPHEGALTRGVASPLLRALYGVRIRQPAAPEFACSARLLDRLLDDDLWDRDGAQSGVDLWVTTVAVADDFNVAEAMLGVRSHHPRGEAAPDLGATVTQIVGALFADLERHVDVWQRRRGSRAVQLFGDTAAPPAPRGGEAHPERLIESCRLGYRELRDIWTWVMPPRTILDLRRIVEEPPERFRVGDELWARIIYDFALAYRMRTLAREHLLQSLVPLYLGWLASFVLQVRDGAPEAIDGRLEQLGAAFEEQKPYLIARWRWPERLRT
jgi:hypothetical protein